MNQANGPRLRALVVDDEPPARRRLQQLLEASGRVEVVALARSVAEALQLAEAQAIDVAFLDVHMPGEDGFAFAEKVPFDVPIVFVTAHSTFAVRAFEVAALDYVLKPVDPSRLAEALDRVSREIRRRGLAMAPVAPVSAAKSTTGQEVLCLQVSSGARFVPLNSIVCIMARDDYTEVVLEDGTSELVSVTMRRWTQQLPGDRFTRLHRGAIAATDLIERVELLGGRWQVHVRGRDQVLPLSREVARELAGRPRRLDPP
jgi:two-component system LytT family response regulator